MTPVISIAQDAWQFGSSVPPMTGHFADSLTMNNQHGLGVRVFGEKDQKLCFTAGLQSTPIFMAPIAQVPAQNQDHWLLYGFVHMHTTKLTGCFTFQLDAYQVSNNASGSISSDVHKLAPQGIWLSYTQPIKVDFSYASSTYKNTAVIHQFSSSISYGFNDAKVQQVLKETHKTLAPMAAGQAIECVLDIDPDLPKWVHIDPYHLMQDIINLTINSLKFTEQGAVNKRVQFESDPFNTEVGQHFLQVQDTGIGVTNESIDHIFEPFIQLNIKSNLDNYNSLRGNGLGLSITKNLIENFGGTTTLASQIGVGSTLKVDIPFDITTTLMASEIAPESAAHQNQIYLLVVDDHATNRLVASATIKRDLLYACIEETRNGKEAIEKMKVKYFDLVLMELIMPDYSGIEVTHMIRNEFPPPLCDVKVVRLTAKVGD
jgi:CheY-like chemotaxis protein